MMRRSGCGLPLALAVFGVTVGPAHGHGAPSAAEVSKAVEVWRQYSQCEKTRRFASCFELLSRNVRRRWAERSITTAADYAEAKGAEPVTYEAFHVVRVRRSPARQVVVVLVTLRNAAGQYYETHEYDVIREGAQWKIDGKREGQYEFLP